jgi:hypothetical protein
MLVIGDLLGWFGDRPFMENIAHNFKRMVVLDKIYPPPKTA